MSKKQTTTRNAKPSPAIDGETSAAVSTGIGLALCAMLNGMNAKKPKVKLPPLSPCPFCDGKAELRYTPFPSIGCTNDDCAARPVVTYAYALFKGIKTDTAKGIRTMAELWNTRKEAK